MDKTPAEHLAATLAMAQVASDNLETHQETCPACTVNFKCSAMAYWVERFNVAMDDVLAAQQEARQAALAAR